jgi:hypothetical protein
MRSVTVQPHREIASQQTEIRRGTWRRLSETPVRVSERLGHVGG